MNKVKPPVLRKGSTIGIVTPGSPMPGLVPRRFNRAIASLRALGFDIRESPTTRSVKGYTSGSAQDRARDVNAFFSDTEIDAIICSIGGLHYNHLLRHLDYDLIADNPKIFLGYSDATVLQLALWSQCALVTFSGPACLTQFAEYPEINPYTESYFRRAACASEPVGRIEPSATWTDECLDWFSGEDETRGRSHRENPGWTWLNGGSACGHLVGGCLPSMLHLAGTRYWPSFDGAILVLETPEGSDFRRGLEIPYIDMYLANLQNIGVFDQVAGVVVGRPFGYTEDQHVLFQEIIAQYLGKKAYPVLMGVDYGHTDPLITIPIGVEASLDASKKLFEITESAVQKRD